ncbi:Slit -like protein 2 protein [Trichinella pseudospiralis]|uniref:Slit-like protein 2 protein n=1 Tax=Trichinella pseudospiralis TaxID=6337 RepID=A0A0V1DTZ0_TRIPS|nr:Slit -like protein 2 protein [Trichinella pseudospiralis]
MFTRARAVIVENLTITSEVTVLQSVRTVSMNTDRIVVGKTVVVGFICLLLFLPVNNGDDSLTTTTAADHHQHCPTGCHCLQEPNSQEVKMVCHWPRIASAAVFSTFPAHRLSSLRLHCTEPSGRSRFSRSMFASFDRLRHLTIVDCGNAGELLTFSFIEGLAELKSLHLERLGSVTEVDEDAFIGAKAVEKLALVESGLVQIPRLALCRLGELKVLNLSHNQITSFPELFDSDPQQSPGERCSEQQQLLVFDLGYNEIFDISRLQMRGLSSLRILNLQHNRLETIGTGVFESLLHLQELNLRGNQLAVVYTLPPGVVHLDLSANRLLTGPVGLERLTNLQKLNLSVNRIETFNLINSSPFDSLRILDLSKNHLTNFNVGGTADGDGRPAAQTLSNVTTSNLQQLYLNDNRLDKIDFGRSLVSLRRLDLSRNLLASTFELSGAGLLEHMPSLRELYLSGNGIGHLDEDAFVDLPQLSSVALDHNRLLEVPAALSILPNLTAVDLSHNRIVHLGPNSLDGPASLRWLNLSGNGLMQVDRRAFGAVHGLRVLDLSYNAIEQLSTSCFDEAVNLRELHLQGNQLASLHGVLVNLPALRSVDLSSNRLSTLDLGLLPAELERLQAGNNNLRKVTYFIRRLRTSSSKLRYADFSNNSLKTLDANSLPLSLRLLNVSCNAIELVTGGLLARGNGTLAVVDLRHNRLQSLSRADLGVAERPSANAGRTAIYLRGNPLRCSCSTSWMLEPWSEQLLADRHLLDCFAGSAESSRVALLDDVPADQFLCPYETVCADGCLCCEFEICDCKSVCPVGCHCEHDSRSGSVNRVRCSRAVLPWSIPMQASEILLDGVRLLELAKHAFLGRYKLRRLQLNHTQLHTVAQLAFSRLSALTVLDLSDNRLQRLTGAEFHKLPNLVQLYLHHNRLSVLGSKLFEQLTTLKVLTLHGNRLHLLPVALPSLGSLQTVSLSTNPWRCDCDDKYLLQRWVPERRHLITDADLLYCEEELQVVGSLANDSQSTSGADSTSVVALLPVADGQRTVKINFWTLLELMNSSGLCEPETDNSPPLSRVTGAPSLAKPTTTVPNAAESSGDDSRSDNNSRLHSALIAVLVLCTVVAGALLTLMLRRMYCTTKPPNTGRRSYCRYVHDSTPTKDASSSCDPAPSTQLLQYDLLLCNSAADQPFVEEALLSRLEEEPPYYRVCSLQRDFSAVIRTGEQLLKAFDRSQRVLLLLSDSFVETDWQQPELRAAYQLLLRDKHRKLVLVVRDRAVPVETDPVLGHYVRTNRCLFWTDPMFWDKLHDTVPSPLPFNIRQSNISPNNNEDYSDMYGTIVPSHFV